MVHRTMSDGGSSSARQSASHDKDYSGYHASSKSTASATDNKAGRVGKRQRHVNDDDSMDRSSAKRTQIVQHCDNGVLCLPLSSLNNQMTAQEAGMELARCLHEPKYNLLKDTVEVLGVERTVEFFTQTAEIQAQGGMLTVDGDKKRAPGGVFFYLIKKSVTEEEKKQIFAKHNQLQAKRAKELKRKKWKENEERKKREMKNKAHRQLELFRKELDKDNHQHLGHPPDKNMEKRGIQQKGENLELDYVDLDDPSQQEDGEIVEGWRNGCDDDHDDFLSHVSTYEQLQKSQSQRVEEMDLGEGVHRSSGGGIVDGSLAASRRDEGFLEEKLAAEQFEKTDECELDFGIDLS